MPVRAEVRVESMDARRGTIRDSASGNEGECPFPKPLAGMPSSSLCALMKLSAGKQILHDVAQVAGEGEFTLPRLRLHSIKRISPPVWVQ